MRPARVIALCALAAAAASGYTRGTIEGSVEGTPLHWPNPAQTRFVVQQNVRPDLRNADNRPVISPRSNPLAALQEALDAWSFSQGSRLRLGVLTAAAAGLDPFDGRNVFVFDDTPAIRALTDSALGVTVVTADSSGRILDADIVFNPNLRIGANQAPYSTDRALNTVDLQDIATHLVGRAVGAGPSGVIGAAMFPHADPAQTFRRRLSDDDLAFLAEAYPTADAAARRGEIAGAVRLALAGEPVTGALVTAVDPFTGVLVQTVSSLSDGSYRLNVPAVPTGRYFVYAEPFDGPVIPPDIQLIDISRFRTDFRVEMFGGNAVPSRLDVAPGRTLRADIAVQGGTSALKIELIGVGPAGGSGQPERLAAGPISIPAGQTRDVALVGLGIDAGLREDELRLLGPGVRIREGSVRVDPVFRVRGAPVVRFTVETDYLTRRTLVSLLLLRNRVAEVYTGAIVVEPAPAFSAGQVVSAASFEAGAVAPGGIVSIFGESLGPVGGRENTSFDESTGLLGSELGGVRVTFDGIPAPLFFVSAGQINLQAPFEIAGRGETVIRVELHGVAGVPITAPVAAANPGVFALPGSARAVALNEDGSLNSPDLPAFGGEVITVFATGQGAVEPPLPTGAPATADPLRRSAAPRIAIGGVALPPGNVLFSGLTPGLVGLLQVNLRIPQAAPSGDSVPLTVSFGGAASKPVNLSIR